MTTTAPKSPLPKAMSAAPPPLLLTIRFSAALPDLELDIPRPSATTVVSLKHLIRSRLDKAHARRRLRFIHGGKILPDTAVLSSVLRALPPPPSAASVRTENGPPADPERWRKEDDESGTGKSKSKGKSVPGRPEPAPRIYVNCSIGDELSLSELDSEAQAAALPPPTASSHPSHHPSSTAPGSGFRPGLGLTTGISTTSAPRGFDRLLSAGFTASEVHQLRLQFRSIHSSRYTPDTLPSPDSFRRMEDAWIDDNGAAMPTAATNTGADGGGGMLGMGGGGTDSDEVGLVGMVDVLIRGVITGFIWPLGSAGWLIREEGMSSDRWRFMVGVGVMFGVLIGFIRAISGDNK
ncbi:hypothetical protein E0Z10_g8329 [Xylaria hypoxylon]|uniref:Ubiquitin-like domain-containing protein n=1 Tax=Xylaria hypoxylon TaxID=37992 RepID=A0A4Z0YLV4_9PEZI|nr:hypothetical protein E0Z10_g8329 [Xylaria hypoxylon]